MIVMDRQGQLAGACTTSGLAYKMHGRVGDSPIIGSGLYVDQNVGAATGTGLGEVVLRQCSSFLIVELMRNGKSPQKACEEAIRRIVNANKNYKEFQVGLLAVNLKGQVGAYAIQPGFSYALYQSGKHQVLPANSYIK
jgi:N4-(beta-N-acetylglucosaminyl)-L-asparaginase